MDWMTYENLDRIADAFVPAQAIVALVLALIHLARRRFRIVGKLVVLFALGIALVYGMMHADNRFGFWPTFGLDYSTHASVALMLTAVLIAAWRRLWWLWCALVLAYLGLCLYQRYHTVADIAMTALYLVPLHLAVARVVFGNWVLCAAR
jgi:hypothetical protein